MLENLRNKRRICPLSRTEIDAHSAMIKEQILSTGSVKKMPATRFHDAELRFIIESYGKIRTQDISKILNVSVRTIQRTLKSQGLTETKIRKKWAGYEETSLIGDFILLSKEELEAKYQTSYNSIFAKYQKITRGDHNNPYKKIIDGCIIHHIDCDVKNNDPSNLYAFNSYYSHKKAHTSLYDILIKMLPSLLRDDIIRFRNGRYEYHGKRLLR